MLAEHRVQAQVKASPGERFGSPYSGGGPNEDEQGGSDQYEASLLG